MCQEQAATTNRRGKQLQALLKEQSLHPSFIDTSNAAGQTGQPKCFRGSGLRQGLVVTGSDVKSYIECGILCNLKCCSSRGQF